MKSRRPEANTLVSVAVFAPVRKIFDYLFPDFLEGERCEIGQRVWVPFGRSFRTGMILAIDNPPCEGVELKSLVELLDSRSLLYPQIIELAKWTSSYYHHPIGETVAHIFPARLRGRKKLPGQNLVTWKLTEAGRKLFSSGDVKGVRRRDMLTRLSLVDSMTEDDLTVLKLGYSWRQVLKGLSEQKLAVKQLVPRQIESSYYQKQKKLKLNSAQINACNLILKEPTKHRTILLYGVTGSGKTEVYIDAAEQMLERGRQSLILVPEITLTEQIVARFKDRFGSLVGVLHSQCRESEKIETWDKCRTSEVKILIGTRSAVWTPMKELGLIVVDEEHDSSYKQQEGLLYSARDVAVKRGQLEKIPIVLGSATPSLETLANVSIGKYEETKIEHRAKEAAKPIQKLVDLGSGKIENGIGENLISEMKENLNRGGQVLLFLNRRGYAPTMMCSNCGVGQVCRFCDRHLVFHKAPSFLMCHHCGWKTDLRSASRCCDRQHLFDLGVGTEKVEEAIRARFPGKVIDRIDRDKVRNLEAIKRVFEKMTNREIDILIGTQMIAKGLDFSGITLVGIIDADSRLYSADYKSEERLAQLLTQVAGRSGRASEVGSVLIQSHQPKHPVLQQVVYGGYRSYSSVALLERREMRLPPFAALAVLRAEASSEARAERFLCFARRLLVESAEGSDMFVSDPIPAVIQRRGGRFRNLVVLQCTQKRTMQKVLSKCILKIEDIGRKIRTRWSLDVDPEETT